MAVALRSVGVSPGSHWGDSVIVKPVGLAEGDLMIAHIVQGDTKTVTPPANWTSIREDVRTTLVTSSLFWKIADGDDVAAADFTFGMDVADTSRAAISAWTGHEPDTPINADNGQGNADSTTVTSPAITPSVANCMVLMFCAVEDDNTHSTYAIADDNPGGWTEAYDLLTGLGGDCSLAMGYVIRPETSATGLGTATTSASDANVGQLVAIAPAPTETSYDTLVGAKTSWAWDKCDYDSAEECPVGAKASWAWGVPTASSNQTMQGAKSSWAWDTT